ncbi:hypothetical protein ACGC1H_005982 [Rhizoctonia solani]
MSPGITHKKRHTATRILYLENFTTIKGDQEEQDSEHFERTRIYDQPQVGGRAQANRSIPLGSTGEIEWKPTGGYSRKDWRCNTPVTTYRNTKLTGSSASCYPTLRRPSGPRRSKLRSCFSPHFRHSYKVFFPGLQSAKGSSAGFTWEPDGFGGALDPVDFFGYGGFSNSGSMNGVAFQLGQGRSSDLETGLEMSNDSLQFLLDIAESIPSIPTLQSQYREGNNLSVQQPLHAPSPPVPLPTDTQCDPRGSERDVTEPAPNIHSWHHQTGGDSTMQASNHVPPPPSLPSADPQSNASRRARDAGFVAGWFSARGGSLPQPQESGPEWNAGFVAGCMLASRMPVSAPSASQSQSQSNPTRTSTQIAPSIRASILPTDVSQSLSTAASVDISATLLLPLRASQNLAAPAVHQQPHNQAGPSTSQLAHRSHTPNGTQRSGSSTFEEPASEVNNNTSAGSTIGPTRRRHYRKRHKCSDCGKEFSGKYRLENHMNRDHLDHTEGYICEFPGCERSYANQAGMRRHYKAKHQGEGGNLEY